jgi:hypothetical protein
MSKLVMGIIAFVVIGLMVVVGVGVSFVSTLDSEAGLRTAMESKQKANTADFDNMKKKITQVAQVTTKQMESLKDIFANHAQARAGKDGQGGAVMNWIKESIPNIDTSTFKNLQNIIVSSRDSWTMRQKELVDLERQRTQMFRQVYSGIVLNLGGRRVEDITITVVTSASTKEAFATGEDNDTDVFKE